MKLKLYVDAEAGQSVEEFAMELCWIANRLEVDVLGKFDGVEIEAVAGSVPSDLVRLWQASSLGVC